MTADDRAGGEWRSTAHGTERAHLIVCQVPCGGTYLDCLASRQEISELWDGYVPLSPDPPGVPETEEYSNGLGVDVLSPGPSGTPETPDGKYFRLCAGITRRFVFWKLGGETASSSRLDDVYQESWLKLLERREEVEDADSPEDFAWVVCVNRGKDFLHRKSIVDLECDVADKYDDPFSLDSLAAPEVHVPLDYSDYSPDPRTQEVLRLMYEGWTLVEIAEKLSVSVSLINGLLGEVRRNLRSTRDDLAA